MPQSPPLITPSQIRAGRALLNWTQERLAKEADISVGTVRDYENEKRGHVVGALRPIEHALFRGGVEFTHANDANGPGVRLQGKLPDVLRWPTKRGDQGELMIRIDWKGTRYEVYLSEVTLEDLAELGHEPDDETYLAIVEEHRRAILKAAAAKVDSGQLTPDHRIHLSDSDVRAACST